MRPAHEIVANKGLIKGFLQPIFYKEDGTEAALDDEGFKKVRDGYACGACLCEYVTYLMQCPVCGHTRDLAKDLIPPRQHEVDHLRDRESGMDAPVPRGIDEFLGSVSRDENIEQVDLSKMIKKRKRH